MKKIVFTMAIAIVLSTASIARSEHNVLPPLITGSTSTASHVESHSQTHKNKNSPNIAAVALQVITTLVQVGVIP